MPEFEIIQSRIDYFTKDKNFKPKVNEILANIEARKNFMPKQKATELNDYQQMRIQKMMEFWFKVYDENKSEEK